MSEITKDQLDQHIEEQREITQFVLDMADPAKVAAHMMELYARSEAESAGDLAGEVEKLKKEKTELKRSLTALQKKVEKLSK